MEATNEEVKTVTPGTDVTDLQETVIVAEVTEAEAPVEAEVTEAEAAEAPEAPVEAEVTEAETE
jgi:hypothetical protein